MSRNLVAELTKAVDELITTGAPISTSVISGLAEQVSRAFGVKPEEVALLALTQKDRFLTFVVPEKLGPIGSIPMTSTNALAVRTARDKRPEIINNFTSARHATVFEAVPLGKERGDPIQKIMSAPLTAENKVVGVIQVSRKGRTVSAAGPDFSPKDLNELVAVGAVLGKCIKHLEVG